MKNLIENKIKENREAFDTDKPDDFVWDTIHEELHPEKKKRFLPLLKIAAIFIVAVGTAWYFMNNKVDRKEMVSKKFIFNSDSIKSNDLATESKVNKSELAIKNANTYVYNADSTKNIVFRRKVVRGGSWENMGYLNGSGLSSFRPFRGNTFKSNGNSTIVVTDANSCANGLSFSSTRAGTTTLNYSLSTSNSLSNSNSFGYNINNQSWSFGDNSTGTYNRYGKYDTDEPKLGPGYYYEQYDEFTENKFVKTLSEAVSTFGIDVDKAGYSNVRRFINEGFLPPKNAVKLEEMVNYFNYDLPEPTGAHPFSITTEVGNCPWNNKNKLMQVCIKGKTIAEENFPASNLVFLIDVSGSMDEPNKLPLLKQGFKMLVDKMREQDKVSIVVYAGAAGVVLEPTSGNKKEEILEALDNLSAGGSTAGGEGIEMAYKLAEKNFMKEGNNRVVLATDGDFNVGIFDDNELIKLIEKKRKSGVFISVLGFGEGNLQSSKMEKIADNGNGNYSYIDNILEAKKVLVTEMGGTLHTIAKDVKLQLEFNPKVVESYRLLGYENRMLATEDFDNDLKDAGDLGSGHSVVALYEITPAGNGKNEEGSLKYQTKVLNANEELSKEMVTIKFRYKEPAQSKSKLLSVVVKNENTQNASNNFLFASAVAEFGMLMRESEYKSEANFDKVIQRAKLSKGKDENGDRAEFVKLCEYGKIIFNEYQTAKKQNFK